MKNLLVLTVASLGLALPAAAATLYECQIREAGNTGWIPEELFVVHNDGAGSAEVHDPVTYYYNNEKPITAKVDVNNNKRVTFVWTLRTQDSRNQNANMKYRATYVKGRKQMNIMAVPGGYQNGFQGQGTCTLSNR